MRMQVFGIFLFKEYTNTTWRYALMLIQFESASSLILSTRAVPSCFSTASRMVRLIVYQAEVFSWCRTRILLGIMILLFSGAIALLASSASIRPGT